MGLVKKVRPAWDGVEHRASSRTTQDLLAELRSADPDARRWAAVDLAGSPEVAPALVAALPTETDRVVRDAILTTLVGLGGADTAGLLSELLRSDDAALRNAVAESLAQMPDATHVVRDLLHDSEIDVRILAVMVLTLRGGSEVNAWLAPVLEHDSDQRVVAAAIEGLTAGESARSELLAKARLRFPDDPFIGFTVNLAEQRGQP